MASCALTGTSFPGASVGVRALPNTDIYRTPCTLCPRPLSTQGSRHQLRRHTRTHQLQQEPCTGDGLRDRSTAGGPVPSHAPTHAAPRPNPTHRVQGVHYQLRRGRRRRPARHLGCGVPQRAGGRPVGRQPPPKLVVHRETVYGSTSGAWYGARDEDQLSSGAPVHSCEIAGRRWNMVCRCQCPVLV